MKLVLKSTGREVHPGNVLVSFRGEAWILHSWTEPGDPGQSGKVSVHRPDQDPAHAREFFVTVFGLTWKEE